MDLIKWELSAATALAGQQTTNYPYIVLLMDTDELDILLDNPESHEAYTYFSQHCIASHLCNANSRSGSSFLDSINLSFAQYLQKHRGRYADDGTTSYKIVPNSISFPQTKPRAVSFYQSHYGLISANRNIPIEFDSVVGCQIEQYFDVQQVSQIVYSTGNSSAQNQRPHFVRVEYLDTEDNWILATDLTFSVSPLALKFVDVNAVCKGARVTLLTPRVDQIGWSVDSFYCLGDGVDCIVEEPVAALLCPVMWGVNIYPQLAWTNRRTPVLKFDLSEIQLNRKETNPVLPVIMLTDQIILEASIT